MLIEIKYFANKLQNLSNIPKIIFIQIFQLPDSLIESSGFVKKKGEDVTSPMVF